jgi:hypothetical protein
MLALPSKVMEICFIVLRYGHTISYTEEKRKAYKVLVGKCEGMSVFGRWRHKWQYNTVMDVKETVWMWKRIHLAQDRDQ